MPRHARGPYLWLRPPRERGDPSIWIIRDAGRQFSTGLGVGDRGDAERRLAEYIAGKYAPARRERDIADIPIADVINVYLADVAPSQARPEKAAERCGRLLGFFGERRLNEVTGATCRAYAERRGSNGGARRDLQDLAAAIGHHAREGLHRSVVRVALPPKGQARQRWLTRDEVARLLWTCWRNREVQEGKPTDKRPLRHLVRVLLIGVYTGSRPGAILNASWRQGPGLSWVDTINGVFHRHAEGDAESTKRQPTVRLSPRLLAHLRRWKRLDGGRRTYVVSYHGYKVRQRQDGAPHRLQAGWRRAGHGVHATPHRGVMAGCARTADSEGGRLHRHGRTNDLEPLRTSGAGLSGRSRARDRPKSVAVAESVASFLGRKANPLRRLVGRAGLEPATRPL